MANVGLKIENTEKWKIETENLSRLQALSRQTFTYKKS